MFPDGMSVGAGYEGKKLFTVLHWWEVKATKNQVRVSSFQIGKELDNLNKQNFTRKAYTLVTTA